MKIDLRNLQREHLGSVQVDEANPPSRVRPDGEGQPEVYLDWDRAFDDQKHLRQCPACGCRELFVRKDFDQVTGFVIVVLAGIGAMVLFGFQEVLLGIGLLAAVVLIDAVIYFFSGRCLVCYRCRSELRDTPIPRNQAGWDLAIGEKYRQSAATAPVEPPDTRADGDRP